MSVTVANMLPCNEIASPGGSKTKVSTNHGKKTVRQRTRATVEAKAASVTQNRTRLYEKLFSYTGDWLELVPKVGR